MTTYRGPDDPGDPVSGARAPGARAFDSPQVVATDVDRGKKPTKKLIAITATAVAIALARIALEALGVDMDDDLEQLINAIVPLIVGYVTPNDLTPGGVPDAKPKILDLNPDEER